MNSPSNKYCHNCGKQTQAGSKFCPSCGTSLASIDEKPPGIVAPTRPQTKAQSTFTPIAYSENDDDDEGTIKADRVNSIHELGISLGELDFDIRVPNQRGESVASLVQQGKAMPEGYVEAGRITSPVDSKIVLEQIQREAGTLRNK